MAAELQEDDRLVEARRWRRAIGGDLLEWYGHTESDDGRHRLIAAECTRGPCKGAALLLDGRWQPWPIDLEREARRLLLCERGACLLAGPDGSWLRGAFRCKSRACPVCARYRAAARAARDKVAFQRAAAGGAQIALWTFTQRTAEVGPPALVMPREAELGWQGYVPWGGEWHRDVPSPAAQGETIGEAYARLREGFRLFRQSLKGADGVTRRGRRDVVQAALGGYLYGVEWTGRRKLPSVPRWHAHLHVLTASLEVGDHVGKLRSWMQHEWCDLAGGELWAQDVQDVGPDRIAEVVKYPFKPTALTTAQRIAVFAHMRGLRPQHLAGHFYGRSAQYEPWRSWMDGLVGEDDDDPSEFRRLYYEAADGEPILFTDDAGLGAEQVVWWRLPARGTQRFRRWKAPAGPYFAELGRGGVPELDHDGRQRS